MNGGIFSFSDILLSHWTIYVQGSGKNKCPLVKMPGFFSCLLFPFFGVSQEHSNSVSSSLCVCAGGAPISVLLKRVTPAVARAPS